MASRWIKACFLLVLGIVILIFADKLVHDLKVNAEGQFGLAFEWTWTLMTWLLWILVAWLFVDAGLIVALSFTDQKHTISDVMKRLDGIEKQMGVPESDDAETSDETSEETLESASPVVAEGVPPPPKE